MNFDALSNAVYHVSLRGPGAEIERGLNNNTPAGDGKSRGPAGRGLSKTYAQPHLRTEDDRTASLVMPNAMKQILKFFFHN